MSIKQLIWKEILTVLQTFPKVFLNLLGVIDDVEEKWETFKYQAPEKSKRL